MDDSEIYTKSLRGDDATYDTVGYLAAKDKEKLEKGPTLDNSLASTRLYLRRWITLAIFCLLSMSNSFNWIQYSTISNIIVQYYNVSYMLVDWTSMVFMVSYIPLIVPATWVQERYGLRLGLILGSFGNALGGWIKCFSANRDYFYVTFLGQTVIAVSQVFILSVPPKLAAVWFGCQEISLATAIGVFGNQLGIALGFWIPTLLVPNSDKVDEVTHGLMMLFLGGAVVTSVVFMLTLFGVPERPERLPSVAQCVMAKCTEPKNNFKTVFKTLLCNYSFIQLFLAYGINVGSFYAISTLLNQTLLPYFPEEEAKFGFVGFVIIVTGMVGSIVCGWWLDKTKRFKLVNTSVCLISLFGMVFYIVSIEKGSITSVFLAATLLGFSLSGYLPIGLEYAAEITFPCSEGISSGLMNASAQIFGILITTVSGYILQNVSVLWCNFVLAATILLAGLLTGLMNADYKRQKAAQFSNTGERKTSSVDSVAVCNVALGEEK